MIKEEPKVVVAENAVTQEEPAPEKEKPAEPVNFKQLSALIDAKQEFTQTGKPIVCFAFAFFCGFLFHPLFCILH